MVNWSGPLPWAAAWTTAGGRPRSPAPPRAGDNNGDRAVALLTAIEQPQRLDDPAGCLVVRERDRPLVEPGGRVGRSVPAVRDRDHAEVLAGRTVGVHVALGHHRDHRGGRAEPHRVVPAVVDP